MDACITLLRSLSGMRKVCGYAGQMLAALLGWPQATFASKVEADPAAGTATVTREVLASVKTLSCGLASADMCRRVAAGLRVGLRAAMWLLCVVL